jgi:hypothetical protein
VPLKGTLEAPTRREPLPAPGRTLGQIVREAAGSDALDRLRRKVFTPVRLVLAGILSVIALTAWWIAHVRALEHAERTVVSASRLGERALADNDLPEAARQFQMARASLDVLGRNDPQSRALRQTAGEVIAAAGLVHASLFEILEEANEAAAGRASLTWSETFRLSYRDTWVVLDASVSRAIDPSGGHRFDIDFPLPVRHDQAVVVGDMEIFEKAVAADGAAKRVIFAAQLEDCRLDPGHQGVWKISLRPSTGFLWSSGERLELLGMGVDDATKRLLDEQTGLLGIDR